MKIYRYILAIQIIVASLLFASCKDDLDFGSGYIGDGEALVSGTLEFKTLNTKLGSRSNGEAIQDINTVSVLVYEVGDEPKLIKLFEDVSFKSTSSNNTPSDYPTIEDENGQKVPNTTEPATTQVTFQLPEAIPYGKYYIYAVANVTFTEEQKKTDIQTIDGLKSISFPWQFDEEDMSENSQMFGYFTNETGEGSNTAFGIKDNDGNVSDPMVIINQKEVTLYSWIQRLASKVTVAFDGSGLHNGITVYIHNVSIRQIPYYCYLGKKNSPENISETPELNAVTPAYFQQSVPNTSQVLYYNNNGYADTPTEYDSQKHNDWLIVKKGTGILPAAYENTSGNDEPTAIKDYPHLNSSPALFFYENMQGNWKGIPEKSKIPNPDQVAENWYDDKISGPESNDEMTDIDYKDGVPTGTFIEVEAYYNCGIQPVSYGKIRYRFMLGQDCEYNYDAIRNHHYKVTLGFNGYANQPDWHIEYKKENPKIYAPEVYIPYTYNTEVDFPITIEGDILELEAEIIENNWAPYFDNSQKYKSVKEGSEVPDETLGTGQPDFANRTLGFSWNRKVYLNNTKTIEEDVNPSALPSLLGYNTTKNGDDFVAAKKLYLYGLHKTDHYQLNEDGQEIKDDAHCYYVTPIWAGFLRLQQPEDYEIVGTTLASQIPTVLIPNSRGDQAQRYGGLTPLRRFRDYYFGYGSDNGENLPDNKTPLNKRTYDVSQKKEIDRNNRNSYAVDFVTDGSGKRSTNVTIQLWTQPKSMCANSGFSGNNPYEDYNRKAVIRLTGKFRTSNGTKTISTDVTVYQAKRLVNPKAVWRSHNFNNNPQNKVFHVDLKERDIDNREDQTQFRTLTSQGEWSATIKGIGDQDFITLGTRGSSHGGGTSVYGDDGSLIQFDIKFLNEINFDESRCAIIEVKYHGNNCVHNIFVRQGYHEPIQLSPGGPYWSSYNVYSASGNFDQQSGDASAVLTHNPLALGAFFKRGNYNQAISVSNISTTGMGPLQAPNGGEFQLSGSSSKATWKAIKGITTDNWHWTNSIKVNLSNETTRTYRVPTVDEYNDLLVGDFGIGVLYGDGAYGTAGTTTSAYGYLAPENDDNTRQSEYGMRGFICYNPTDAKQVFFPIGTSGIGRRTIQSISNSTWEGTLRYGATPNNLTSDINSLRPVSYNMSNSPGSIYWTYSTNEVSTTDGKQIGWDMNYFDLNISPSATKVICGTGTTAAPRDGDALPIRLVCDDPNK